MGDGDGPVRKTKTISIDPSTLVVGGSRGSRRTKSRSGGGADGTRRTTVTRRSRAEAKAEVEAKSAAVQEAVMKALMTQPAPPPPPPPSAAKPGSDVSSTRSVAFDDITKPAATPGPRSVNAVQNALNDLNRLIEDRARERARKTIRAERRRGESAYAPASNSISDLAPASAPPTPCNLTPLEPNSTAASNASNRPPWGCLKGGNLPTFREHMRTQRARRKQHSSKSNANATPRVRIQTPQEAAAAPASATPANSTHTSALADTVITVGRKDNGRVAFVVGGGGGTRRTERTKRSQRSVTNRAKLRKARLLKGGNKAPQRLVDVIAESVDIIGDVVRPHDDTSITVQA